jgi:hypothetical protein
MPTRRCASTPNLRNTCLVDVYGGSAVFYDTRVKVVKV